MGEYRNPVLDGCHPDPSICRVGEDYYLVTSTFEYLPGLPIHHSRNLADWELVGHVIHRADQLDYTGISSSRGLFAPTLRHHDGRFWVVCTMMPDEGSDSPRHGHFISTATDPAGPWSDPVWIDGIGGIDPSLTFDDGRIWLCGTRLSDPDSLPGQTEVWLTQLDPATLQPTGPLHVLWRGALRDAVWAEGPHLYRRPDGTWLLLAAEGGTEDDHAICVAYAPAIEGPYLGDPGNPRLTHRDLGAQHPIRAVGHADVTDTASGATVAVLLASHVRDGRPSLCGRQTHLVPVSWEGHRPLFAPGVGRVTRTVVADAVGDQAARPSQWVDRFETATLDPAWTSVRWHPHEFATARRPGIALAATVEGPADVGRTAFLGRRLPADEVTIRVVGTLRPDAGALHAGILLRIGEHAHCTLTLDEAGHTSMTIVGPTGATTIGGPDADPGGPVVMTLRLHGRFLTASVADRDVGTVDAAPLRDGLAGAFVGAWVGPFAVGSGTYDVDEVALHWTEAP